MWSGTATGDLRSFPRGFPETPLKLIDRTVAGLALAGKTDAIWFDDALTGFGYRMRAGARGRTLRSWIVQYRHGGRPRRYLLGAGEVLGAEQARAAARKLLARIALGEDPQATRGDRRGRDRLTLRSVVDNYLASAATRVRVKTLSELRRYLTGRYFRALHGAAIDRLDRREIATRLVAIERESGAPTAAKARAAMSSMYVWAMRSGLTDSNPAGGTPKPSAGRGRDRVLVDDELAAIWSAAGDADYGRIVKLLIMTAARRSEIGGMAWSELDFEAGIWTLPAARSKNGRVHALPIMPMMRAIVDQVPRRASRDYLFGERGAGFGGWNSGKRALDRRSGISGWVIHDLRRSAATSMANLGVQPHIIEEILAHSGGHKSGVAGIYNKATYAAAVRAALGVWHDHVRAIAAGGARKVLPFAPP
jgi:integrase